MNAARDDSHPSFGQATCVVAAPCQDASSSANASSTGLRLMRASLVICFWFVVGCCCVAGVVGFGGERERESRRLPGPCVVCSLPARACPQGGGERAKSPTMPMQRSHRARDVAGVGARRAEELERLSRALGAVDCVVVVAVAGAPGGRESACRRRRASGAPRGCISRTMQHVGARRAVDDHGGCASGGIGGTGPRPPQSMGETPCLSLSLSPRAGVATTKDGARYVWAVAAGFVLVSSSGRARKNEMV